MLRIISITLILLSSATMQAQQYQYIFTDGWSAYRCLETGADSLTVIGLRSKNLQQDYQKHRYQFDTYQSSSLLKLKSDSFLGFNLELISLNSAFSIIKDSDKIYIGGLGEKNDTLFSTITKFDSKLKLSNLDLIANGKSSFTYSLILRDTIQYLFGIFQEDVNVRAKIFFSRLQNGMVQAKKTFSCGGKFPQFDDCNIFPRQMIQSGNNFMLATTISPSEALYDEIQDGLIIKVDSIGGEQWRLAIENDSTTCHNLLIAPLANGNLLAIWQDAYYKPFKASGGTNPFPLGSVNVTTWLMEFTADGEIIKTSNLRKHLKHKFWNTPQPNFHNHLITTEDSSIILVGNASNRGTNGYDLGYALKLDKNGNYLWYRQYELDVDKPHGTGQEKLFLNGVTQLSTGGYALAGEYRSDPSDSFPNGTQKGVVLFVDAYGCLEPGCQLTDGVAELQTKQAVFRVYPNPSSGQIEVRSERLDIRLKKIEVFDMQGMLVYSQSSTSNSLTSTISHLSSNLYYLKIYRD
ncbi:MAG: T9SS type A sorting domain-containing protein, partial [Bacteroidia bacterium]